MQRVSRLEHRHSTIDDQTSALFHFCDNNAAVFVVVIISIGNLYVINFAHQKHITKKTVKRKLYFREMIIKHRIPSKIELVFEAVNQKLWNQKTLHEIHFVFCTASAYLSVHAWLYDLECNNM